MIDLHTHILPHIDDGAKDSSVTAEILRKEVEQGVKTVVFTPHYYCKKRTPEQFVEKRARMFEHIQPLIPENLSVRLGCELHFTGLNMPEFEELCKLAIEGTKYILLEFPFTTAWSGELLDKVNEFIEETEYRPIIAHIERYREVQKNPAYASVLVDMGCLLQVNADSFLDKRDKKLAFALLEHGLVHCLGTDSHDAELRSPKYTEAKAAIYEAGLGNLFEQAQENMRAILADEEVELMDYTPVKKTLFGYK